MNMNHSTAFPYREARIDSAIEIGDLDRQGIERLIRAMFPITMLEDDIDWPPTALDLIHGEGYSIVPTATLTWFRMPT